MFVQGLCCVAALFSFPGYAAAKLEFETERIEIQAEPTDERVEGKFGFTNVGDRDVTITATWTSCGCTHAKLQKKTFKPGESGEVRLLFDIGERQGRQQHRMLLQTDASGQGTVSLRLVAHVPELVEVEPRLVYWREGREPTTQTIMFEVTGDQPIRVANVKAEGEDFDVTWSTKEDEEDKYEIRVTPHSTAEAGKAKIRIITDWPKEKPRVWTATARVISLKSRAARNAERREQQDAGAARPEPEAAED